ncbi:hypothetical protein [Klebsiella variicola]|uniref:hypothetical protein n=1 Tax=Klebsiella variicola TaxID=244366 RepID=UPI002B05468C|nr:hypothetical protein [Klebsiella variicola]
MKLLQWTLFIDMLGYRDLNGTINTETKAIELIEFMEMNKYIFDSQNTGGLVDNYNNSDAFNLYEYYDIKYSFISDSFILTFYPLEVERLTNLEKMYMHSANALFIIAMRLQTFIFNCFSEKGVFLRGGVSNRYCYIKDSFAVGEGLIEAYKIESTLAIYPRIAFSSEIIENKALIKHVNYLSTVMYNGNKLITRDRGDDIYYLDYLGLHLATIDTTDSQVQSRILNNRKWFDAHLKLIESFVEKHALNIQGKLNELYLKSASISGNEKKGIDRVIDKFEWLKNYHNSRIRNNSLVSHLKVN